MWGLIKYFLSSFLKLMLIITLHDCSVNRQWFVFLGFFYQLKKKITSVSLRPNNFFLPKIYTMYNYQWGLCYEDIWHTHRYQEMFWFKLLLQVSVNKLNHSCFSGDPSPFLFCTSWCLCTLIICIIELSRPVSVHHMQYYVSMFSLTKLPNLHVIWSSCHHVCIR